MISVLWVTHRILRGKGRCRCAVGMCENSRQRVIRISSAEAVIFLRKQVACAVSGVVQKVSNLILNIHIYVWDANSGRLLQAMSADIRGNMDEPFVSLDESTAEGLRRLLLQIWQAKPTTVLFVTHDSREAIHLAQRIIVLCTSPATVNRDQSVALTAEQRADPLQLEALREQFR